MEKLFLLLLSCHLAATVKHSLKYFLTSTSGLPNFPEFVGAAMVDDVQIGYCDSSIRTAQPKQAWMRELIKKDPRLGEWYSQKCSVNQQVFRGHMDGLKQRFNQTGGAHILQRMNGCEWDSATGEVVGFNQYGYDGEDFIALDLQTLTWTAPTPQAFITKLRWDTDRARLEFNRNYYIHKCPEQLKKYVECGRSLLLRTDLPSVSLLQRTPSSAVTCHATGFYPDGAMMFWRKDGVEHHEDVDHGEILPNHDGSFQLSVELKLTSVAPGDWSRYDCVVRLSGVKDDILTKLDKAVIRTNQENPPGVVRIVGFVVLLLLLAVIIGLLVRRRIRSGLHHHPGP
ncbi:major histocompatibility complex class I-related gene protein-like [Pungitius pungitius]|uniref:major histocompatibility complex class I-related gene protein-like n=1 Tax=Pungitius pungitius TaxID=134920 RepID=UPI002E0FED1D